MASEHQWAEPVAARSGESVEVVTTISRVLPSRFGEGSGLEG